MCLYMCSKQDYDYFVARNYFHPSFLSQSQKWGWLFAKMSTQERLNLDPVNIFTSSVQPKIIQSNWVAKQIVCLHFFFFFFLHAAIDTFTSCYIFGICNSLCDFLAPTVYWATLSFFCLPVVHIFHSFIQPLFKENPPHTRHKLGNGIMNENEKDKQDL